MGRQLTTGQICKKYDRDGYANRRKEEGTGENIPLPQYIKEKVKVLHELQYLWVKESDFSDCTNEIQVDNRAHTIIFGVRKRYVMA